MTIKQRLRKAMELHLSTLKNPQEWTMHFQTADFWDEDTNTYKPEWHRYGILKHKNPSIEVEVFLYDKEDVNGSVWIENMCGYQGRDNYERLDTAIEEIKREIRKNIKEHQSNIKIMETMLTIK